MCLRIGFISTRISGLDGVSLETKKWVKVLEEWGHKIFYFAGELDTPEDVSYLVPEAHFKYQVNEEINQEIFNIQKRPKKTTKKIEELKQHLKEHLEKFVKKFDIQMLIVENALAIPMHIPLGLAITELIAETGIPTIGHHHDFFWERSRFLINAVNEYIEMAFPPNLPFIRHVVINSIAQQELAARKGVSSFLIPNVIDFSKEPQEPTPAEKQRFLEYFGFEEDAIIFLQPTRVVARKGIEHAIQLVRKLNNPKIKLVITHSKGDEGLDYYNWLIEYARSENINIYFVDDKLNVSDSEKEKGYTLWDVYPYADFVTYPSSFEGFGNAFLEAIYYKKPLLVNRYPIYITDIEPKGFKTITMNGFLTEDNIKEVKRVLEDSHYKKLMVDENFKLGKKYFSFDVLRKKLLSIFISFYGVINENDFKIG